MKNILALLVSFLIISKTYSQSIPDNKITLSDSSVIALITCDPGNELYASFGHSAIGVFDYKKNLQIVFNYGTFSFNTPFFYIKFARGKLNYTLSISTYERFLEEYKREGKMVLQEELNLNHDEKQALFSALLENYRPENREYAYDFFFDNCATRIIDILDKVLKDKLQYHSEIDTNRETFRNLIDSYLNQGSWSDAGIDLALGAVIDKPPTEKQKTFLPYYLSQYVNNCTISNRPLIKKAIIAVQDTTDYTPTPLLLTPQFIFWVLFALMLLFTVRFRHFSWIIADRLWFVTMGLVGMLVFLLWFATDHDATANNWNILWANPLFLVYAFFISQKQNIIKKWVSPFFLVSNVVTLLFWMLIPQQFNFVFIPLILINILRLSVIIIRSKKNNLQYEQK